MNKDELIFWFDTPPKVEVGAFNALSKIWPNKVIYVILNDLRQERKKAGWDDSDYANAEVIKLFSESDQQNIINKLITEYPNAIHVGNGFDTPIMKIVKYRIFSENCKFLLFTERPAPIGKGIKLFARKVYQFFKYSKLCREYRKHTDILLPLGHQGARAYQLCGFPKSKIYPFLYCPQLKKAKTSSNIHKPLKFVYVGRFFYPTKGTDVLLKAIPCLHGDWDVSFAGGYGANSDEVISFIEIYPNVHYLGTWQSNEVVDNLANFDVAIVPSTADGWNLIVNEAIHAGVVVISSDQAVSHEVLEKSKSGFVFKSRDYIQLSKLMQGLIDSPDKVPQLKKNALVFADTISDSNIGHYLADILNYTFYNEGDRPVCPWI
ncbi:glycosyltransferase family 4 protein [Macellibacteroides fermentans]|uniref:glycosyltransferase family 4 protein n=1 Tax=Macellibacteroides fermentans TaxID=879969 RepID=UPI00406D4973